MTKWYRTQTSLPVFLFLAVAFQFADTTTSQAQFRAPRGFQPQARRVQNPTVASENFIVTAPTEAFARKVAIEAERYRKELSKEWLGYEIGAWRDKCPIQVKIEMHAGGVTRFGFIRAQGKSQPVEWEMEIFGPPDRVLDSVLPHEVTHTIFATHFGRPLPRWADEGACTTVEHQSEKSKNHQMLMQFLSSRPSRGIPFNRMFSMREYPRDILPLYAQGYSLAKFLIQQKGKREFIRYVETGLAYEDRGMGLNGWGAATKEIYGINDLSDLQIQWLTWVKKGSPKLNGQPIEKSIGNEVYVSNPTRSQSSDNRLPVEQASYGQMQTINADGNWYVKQTQGTAPRNPIIANNSQNRSELNSDRIRKIVNQPSQSNLATSSYRPGSIANAKPLKLVDESLFVRPSSRSNLERRSEIGSSLPNREPGVQFRTRPTIYR